MDQLTAYYFGCWSVDRIGHYLYAPSGRSFHQEPQNNFPVRMHVLDGALLPPRLPEVEGRASFCHLNGWTLLSFWDRSADTRGKCNSTFLIFGNLNFDEMLARCKYHFPSIWHRFNFTVKVGQFSPENTNNTDKE